MKNCVTSIQMTSFRGATKPVLFEFDSSKPVILIYGENGSGKTTIIDALDVVFNKGAGSLTHRSGATLHELPSLGSSARNLEIGIRWADHTLVAHLEAKGIKIENEVALPPAHILYRNRITQLVESQPSQRYEQLRRFIDVGFVEKGEAALISTLNSVKKEYESGKKSYEQAMAILNELWVQAGSPNESALNWASQAVIINPQAALQQKETFDEVIALIERGVAAMEAYTVAMDSFKQARRELQEIKQQIAQSPVIHSQEGIKIVDLLTRAQQYLVEHPQSPNCPVCHQSIQASSLKQSIEDQLDQMQALRDLYQQQHTAENRLEGARLSAINSFKFLREALLTLYTKIQSKPISPLSEILREQHDLLHDESRSEPEDRTQICALMRSLQAYAPNLTAQRDTLVEQSNQARALAINLQAARACEQKTFECLQLASRLKKTLDIVREKRFLFTQAVLSAIREDCKKLYERIHPGERLNLNVFRLDETKRASLQQTASFENFEDVSPTAYFSDSHLETLGVCLFIAVAKLNAHKEALLALDDVFGSIDQEHRRRIAQLLREESQSFAQIFITTHSREWLTLLQETFREQAQTIALDKWHMAQGIHSV
ncbi:MAG: AAA family ATPase [Fimbriimonadia bacterium]|nr:AAA family ATPase [Fimbriimonadia bacterium]